MAGAALGHAVSHDVKDFEVLRVDGQEKAGEGGVALERVVVLLLIQTIILTHTHSHSLILIRPRTRRAHTTHAHTRSYS